MNSHSIALLKKAGVKVSEENGNQKLDTSNINVEKLMELVVLDCATIVEKGYGSNNFGNGSSGFELLERFSIPYKKLKTANH